MWQFWQKLCGVNRPVEWNWGPVLSCDWGEILVKNYIFQKKLQKSSYRDPHVLTIVRSRSCRAMENPELSAEEKIKSLRTSVKRHQVLITKNIWLVQYSNLVLTTCFCPGALQGLYEWQGNRQTFVCTLRRFKRTRTRKPLISSFLSSFFLSSSCVSLGLRLLEASTDVALDTVNKSTTTTANV
jgi:hypothetical protein